MSIRRIWIFILIYTLHFHLSAQEVDKVELLQDLQFLSSDELEGRKPLSPGSSRAKKFITARFEKLGLSSQYLDYAQTFVLRDERGKGKSLGRASNIIGFIPGTESAKIIVISAHYDHLGKTEVGIFNGADDNASGTAALLALAAYFSTHPPMASLMFVALDGEEMGLQGARALVKDFPFPLEDVLVNVNMDMISRSKENKLFAVGTYHYPQFKAPLEKAARGAKINLGFGHDMPDVGDEDWTYSSDHAAFYEKGIPFIYFGVEDHEDYHKITDTFERIDKDFYYEAVNLIINGIKALDESFFD